MAARSYYTHPISKDYIHSEWYSLLETDDESRPSWNEYAETIIFAHIHEYGDDYIEVPGIEDYQTDNMADNQFDFDLLELELDEAAATEAFGDDDDEFRDEEEDFYDEYDNYNRIDATNIPPEILSDPVKLLEWLKKNERQQEDDDEDEDRW
jgi:hypothetical protein